MPNNRLSQIDAIKLADWMRSKQEEIDNAMSGAQVARLVQRELGVRATGDTVVRIGGSLGITFRHSHRAATRKSRIRIVAQSVARLYESLGEDVPEDLADIIQ